MILLLCGLSDDLVRTPLNLPENPIPEIPANHMEPELGSERLKELL
jgi:hypothetical protein